MNSQATLPLLIEQMKNKAVANTVSILVGVALLSLLAQVVIPLFWTPVPITGQTFGVALVALLWGQKRGMAVLGSYLALGSLGLPVFAGAASGLVLGPTLGYLVGMFLASAFVGFLADRGFTTTFTKTLLAAYSGSLIIFACGVLGLSFFLPKDLLLASGVLPFLPGDSLKNILAALIVTKMRNRL